MYKQVFVTYFGIKKWSRFSVRLHFLNPNKTVILIEILILLTDRLLTTARMHYH
jgi:hypothetical protein